MQEEEEEGAGVEWEIALLLHMHTTVATERLFAHYSSRQISHSLLGQFEKLRSESSDSTIYGIIWWFVMGGRQHVFFIPYQIAVRSKVEPVTAYRELDVYRYHLEMFSPPGWRHNFVLNEKLGLPVESSILVEVDTESEIGSAGSPVRQGAGDVHVERQNFSRQ